MSIFSQRKAELAHDLQLGIARKSVPVYDEMPMIGMAAILAVHIRGLGEIEYPVLRQVADHFFDIPAMVLERPLRILEEVGYVTLATSGKTINQVIPDVPHFDSIYTGLGAYTNAQTFNEHEEVSLAILNELSDKPEKRDSLFSRLNADKGVFDRCERVAQEGGIVVTKRARGQDILVSPAYFADNLDALANLAAGGGATRIQKIVGLVTASQGWPMSLIFERGEINGTKLTPDELKILRELVADGVLRPPSIERPNHSTEHFVFTPKPGDMRLTGASRDIYERAMALVAAVRKGQLLPEQFRIHSPVALLSKLRDYKKIGANSEAAHQYKNLVSSRVGKLVQYGTRYEFRLIDTPENVKAVEEAIRLVQGGSANYSGVQDEAVIALTQDEKYIQSLTSSKRLRDVERPTLSPDEQHEVQQLILGL